MWTGPTGWATEIHATTERPGATHKVVFRGDREHFFDSLGRIVARVAREATGEITFSYTGSGLDQVVDSRGQTFDVVVSGGSISSITDPAGDTITYVQDPLTGHLLEVKYPQRDITNVYRYASGSGQGGVAGVNGGGSGELRFSVVETVPVRTFTYHQDSELLDEVLDGNGDQVIAVDYYDDDTARVSAIENGLGGQWTFDDERHNSRVNVKSPRGFTTQYLVDGNRQTIQIRELTAGDGSYPQRPGLPDYYEWNFIRDSSCSCGRVEESIEPDGGKFVFSYDADGNLEHLEQHSASGQEDPIQWTWTHDAAGRVTGFTPPQAHTVAPTNDPDPAWSYTMSRVADTGPTNVGGHVYTVSTPAGNVHGSPVEWVWRYDALGRMIEYEGPSHDGVNPGDYDRYLYYGSGTGIQSLLPREHTEYRDNSIRTEFVWHAKGLLSSGTQKNSTTASEYEFTQEFDAEGLLTRWLAPLTADQQYEVQYFYDANAELAVVRYAYFDQPEVVGGSLKTPVWIEKLFLTNAHGQVTAVETDVEAGETALVEAEYDVAGNLEKVIDPDGRTTFSTFDERDMVWMTFDGYGTTIEVHKEYFYDSEGKLTHHLEPFDGGHVRTDRVYDGLDRPEALLATGKFQIVDTFDAASRLLTRVTENWNGAGYVEVERAEYEYDDWHDGYTKATSFVYSTDGTQLLRTNYESIDYGPSSKVASIGRNGTPYLWFSYDTQGRLSAMFDGDGNREDYSYDPEDGYLEIHTRTLHDEVDGSLAVYEKRYERDPAGRVIEAQYVAPGEPDRVYKYGYDSVDNLVFMEEPNGQVTERVHGYDGRRLEVLRDVDAGTGQASSHEQYDYSSGGRLTHATDDRNKTVSFVRDLRGRLTDEVNADGSKWSWDYDEAGYIERTTTPTGKTFDLTYDTWGRPETRTIKLGTTVLRTDTYVWNAQGHLESATKVENGVTSIVTFTRDSEGRVLTESQDGAQVTYLRDGLGRLQRLIGPSGHFREYAYDEHQRVQSVHQGQGGTLGSEIVGFEWFGPGGALSRATKNGGSAGVLSVGRDGFSSVTSLETEVSGSNVLGYSYDFDQSRRVRYEKREHQANKGDVYSYDGMNRLIGFIRDSKDPVTQADNPGAGILFGEKKDYVLTGTNHRQSVVTSSFSGNSSTESYVVHPDRNHYTNVGGQTRTQSLDGNLLTHGSRSFVYDATDNLISVKDGGVTVASFTYDALGRRLSKTVGNVTTRYVYAGPWLIEEYQKDGSSPEVLDAVHYHGTGVDDVLMSKRVDRADLDSDGDFGELIDLYHHSDRQGSRTALTLGNGSVVESYRYDVYGEPTVFNSGGSPVASIPSGNSFLYTGREYDQSTGYYHYRARTYDPATGSFLQEDPLGLADGLNPVAYVLASPTMFADPMGTSAISDAAADIWDFLQANRRLLGTIIDTVLDILGPLGDLLDLISAASGYDIRGWMRNGFSGPMTKLSWWDRATTGLSSLAGVVGGVVSVVPKLKRIFKKLEAIIDGLKRGKAKKASPKAPPYCFVAGTLVLMLSGSVQAIEDVRVGDLVACEADRGFPEDANFERTNLPYPDQHREVTETVWQRMRLEVLEEASGNLADVVLLRPRAWVARRGVTPGATLWFEVASQHLRGEASVLAVEECPRVAEQSSGERAVVGTFRRQADAVWALSLEGQDEPIIGTAEHPFFSRTRGSWIPLGRLEPGECLETAAGETVCVEGVTPLAENVEVFNLEVHRSHTFYVGESAVAVHNNHEPPAPKRKARSRRGQTDQERVAELRDRRRQRRERQSRDRVGQKRSGEGWRDRESANRGSGGERPKGPSGADRQRNVGVDEEHSRRGGAPGKGGRGGARGRRGG